MIAETVLEGAKGRLRPVREEDLPHFQRWLNNPDVYLWLWGLPGPPSWEDELAWWERIQSSEHELVWSIETTGGRLLGDVTLHWDPRSRAGEFGIFIGEKGEWDKGRGAEAVRLLLGYAFRELGLNRMGFTCDATNARALRCYEKVGFRHEGVMRQHRFVDGEFRNSVVMSMLAREFDACAGASEK